MEAETGLVEAEIFDAANTFAPCPAGKQKMNEISLLGTTQLIFF